MLPVDSVKPNKWNVNLIRDEDFAKLLDAMRSSGPELVEPIVVRRSEDGELEIVDGEQRWRAAKQLGWRHIPAVEIEGDRRAAKYLCLSYNAIRGTVDFVKLAELASTDPEMYEAAVKVFGRSAVEKLVESSKKLTGNAKQILQEAARSGSTVSVDVIQAVASAPSTEVQRLAAEAAKHGAGATEYYVWSVVERYARNSDQGKAVKAVDAPSRREKAVIGGRAVEVAKVVRIEKPGTYALLYDQKSKQVEIMEYDAALDAYFNVLALPKTYSLEVKCRRCGATYNVKVDAETGEFTAELRE